MPRETGVAQADLAGKADQQVQTEDDHGVDRHADGEIHVKLLGSRKGSTARMATTMESPK